VVLGKRDCHLCEAVEAEIRSMPNVGAVLRIIDIDEDPVLRAEYWLRIPVVRVAGEDVFEAKMMDVGGRWRKELAAVLLARL